MAGVLDGVAGGVCRAFLLGGGGDVWQRLEPHPAHAPRVRAPPGHRVCRVVVRGCGAGMAVQGRAAVGAGAALAGACAGVPAVFHGLGARGGAAGIPGAGLELRGGGGGGVWLEAVAPPPAGTAARALTAAARLGPPQRAAPRVVKRYIFDSFARL